MNNTRLTPRRLLAWLAAFVALGSAAVRAADPAPETQAGGPQEREQIEILRSGEPAAKAVACKQLAIHGTKAAVPALAPLLADPQLASWARIALEAIPDPAADGVLIQATETLDGRLLVGTLNSLGVRRSAGAVNRLIAHLKNQNPEVASAAAVALGRIGNTAAIAALRQALAGAPAPVRSAVGEGCILCAERLMADGHDAEAVEIYDQVRQADVPKPRVLEATRGAILARKSAGIPLLVEQLKSPDKGMFFIGLTAARELPGRDVAEALAAELAGASQERAALLIYALADRQDSAVSPAVLAAAKNGEPPVRIAAVGLIGRAGDASSLPALLDIAASNDAEVAEAAQAALVALPGETVNAEIAARLAQAKGRALVALLDVAGKRRISATPAMVKAVDSPDPSIRAAALAALGETIGAQQLAVLIDNLLEPRSPEDAKIAGRALRAAAVRMPDRETCAAELAAALPRASLSTKANLLEILGAMGGPAALQTIAVAMRSNEEPLQDVGSRALGEWMSVDAAPVLLDLAKSASSDKYRVRALRGYIRLARQFAMPPADRALMCQNAWEAAGRTDEQKLVLAVLARYPSLETLRVAVEATNAPPFKEEATRVAAGIGKKIGDQSPEARALLDKAGIVPMKIEIVKAEYGVGATRRDVTETLRKLVRDAPTIALPAPLYNATFGGDPAEGVQKELKIQYRIDGKAGEVTFAEDAPIELPLPK